MDPKIFYDGYDLEKYDGLYVGITTNPSIIRQSGYKSYKTFYDDKKKIIQNCPISFQVFSDSETEIVEQAKHIRSIGTNVYVKVPIVNSKGESNMSAINNILSMNTPVNITAVFTKEQIDFIYNTLINKKSTSVIISIFGGRISDTGVDPKETVKYACDTFKDHLEVEILWCGCRDNLVIQHAKDIGCHIVTLPDNVISRISRIGTSLTSASEDVVKMFMKDALDNKLII